MLCDIVKYFELNANIDEKTEIILSAKGLILPSTGDKVSINK